MPKSGAATQRLAIIILHLLVVSLVNINELIHMVAAFAPN
jgi:hypothetical protein